MFTLNTPTNPTLVDPILARINDIRNSSNDTFNSLFARWRGNAIRFWQARDANKQPIPPQTILDAWQKAYPGDPAKAFKVFAATAALLETAVPGCTSDTMSLIKPFTINETDGSVTINL